MHGYLPVEVVIIVITIVFLIIDAPEKIAKLKDQMIRLKKRLARKGG